MFDYDQNAGLIVLLEEEKNREQKKLKKTHLSDQNSAYPDESANCVTVSHTFHVFDCDSDCSSDSSVSTTSFEEACQPTEGQYPDKFAGKTVRESTIRTHNRANGESCSTRYHLFLIIPLVFLYYYGCFQSGTVLKEGGGKSMMKDTIYVPGAGFSGFWFTLGRLRSIDDPASKHYYCFSAGCLGVVASLRNFTVDEMLDLAEGIQGKWMSSEIGRYQVVGEFVNNLVNASSSTYSTLRSIDEPNILSRLHIITSVKDKWIGLKSQIRSPKTNDELREMLLQTTWMYVCSLLA